MEWPLVLLCIFASFILLMLSGLPVAFAFMLINLVGAFVFMGGLAGLYNLVFSIITSLCNWVFLPIVMFILLGEVVFQSGMGSRMIDTLDEWLGRLPGRLSLLAVGAGTIFGTMSGSSTSGVALLGATLVPEMEERGYKKPMTLGPIMGSGGLAMMIPPSGVAIFLGAIGKISIGKLLIAILIPGLVMAALFAGYIIIRCFLQPSIALPYKVTRVPVVKRSANFIRYVLPLGLIFFTAIGLIFLGVATPSEAAALGGVSSFILAALYRRLNWEVVKKTAFGTLQVSVMIFMILCGAMAFSQILAISGATRGLTQLAAELPVSPILIVLAMQVIVIILGMFMEVGSILMITLPMYMPIILTLGFNPVWFGVIMLLNMEMAIISPPFGLSLFVMKGVAPPDTTMGDIYKASLPFLILDIIAMALIIAFPTIALWLPNLMH